MIIERELFAAVVRRHHAAVYRTARRVVRSDADAADVTQQVFMHAWRGKTTVTGADADVERQLRWLASKLALVTLRAGRRRRHHEQETARSNRPMPDTDSLSADELRAVRASIDALDDSHRATVVLRFHEDLTLAAIGTAMGCAESTVHDRLRAALDHLRRRLRDCGFAAAAGKLEELLGAAGRLPIAVPADLAPKLLAIPTAVGGLAAAKLAVAAVLVLGCGGVAYAAIGGNAASLPLATAVATVAAPAGTGASAREPQDPERRVVTPPQGEGVAPAPANAVAVSETAPVANPAAAAATAPTARIVGSIAAESGEPLADVAVVAWCRALSSKGEPFERQARTDVHGGYELVLPITDRSGLDYRLSLHRADWSGTFATPELHLLAAELRRGVDATMHRWADDAPGNWSTLAVVTDGAGRPIEQANVQVFRRTRDAAGGERLLREAGAATDARGQAALGGDHFGEKLVRVSAWGQPFAEWQRPLAVGTATPAAITVALAADTPLSIRVVDARTAAPIDKVMVTAERDGRSLAVGQSGADGTIVLRGTDAEPCSLTGGSEPWSRFQLDSVTAGRGVVLLRLKRADDPEPVGLSGCELHGRVVDAVTGAPLVVAWGSVHSWWLAPDAPATATSLVVDAITPWPFQTAMAHEPPPPSADFHLSVPQPGRYALLLRVEGRAVAAAGPFDLAAGQLIGGIEIRAEVGVRIEVTVGDAAGAPVAGAEVWIAAPGVEADAARAERAADLAREGRSGGEGRFGRGRRTDASGRAVFDNVPTAIPLCVHAADGAPRHGSSGAFTATVADPAVQKTVTMR